MTQITDQTRWRRVLNHVASDLLALVSIATGQKITVEQATPASLKALVTLAGLRGIIPEPVNATRINLSALASGDATTTIYTVPPAKILFLTGVMLASRESANASSYATIRVSDATPTTKYYPLVHYYDLAGHQASSNHYCPALELAAGWIIEVTSSHANIDAFATIHAWLEDA